MDSVEKELGDLGKEIVGDAKCTVLELFLIENESVRDRLITGFIQQLIAHLFNPAYHNNDEKREAFTNETMKKIKSLPKDINVRFNEKYETFTKDLVSAYTRYYQAALQLKLLSSRGIAVQKCGLELVYAANSFSHLIKGAAHLEDNKFTAIPASFAKFLGALEDKGDVYLLNDTTTKKFYYFNASEPVGFSRYRYNESMVKSLCMALYRDSLSNCTLNCQEPQVLNPEKNVNKITTDLMALYGKELAKKLKVAAFNATKHEMPSQFLYGLIPFHSTYVSLNEGEWAEAFMNFRDEAFLFIVTGGVPEFKVISSIGKFLTTVGKRLPNFRKIVMRSANKKIFTSSIGRMPKLLKSFEFNQIFLKKAIMSNKVDKSISAAFEQTGSVELKNANMENIEAIGDGRYKYTGEDFAPGKEVTHNENTFVVDTDGTLLRKVKGKNGEETRAFADFATGEPFGKEWANDLCIA